jgi:hypothetical protein
LVAQRDVVGEYGPAKCRQKKYEKKWLHRDVVLFDFKI